MAKHLRDLPDQAVRRYGRAGIFGVGAINGACAVTRFEYRQRYLAELVYTPIWGGDYNAVADRDRLAPAVGVKF